MDQSLPNSTTDTAPAMTPEMTWTERGTSTYRRTSIALFLAGFVTFTLVYDVQPLLPEFASDFHVSAATSSLALSVTTAALAIAILSNTTQTVMMQAMVVGAIASCPRTRSASGNPMKPVFA